MDGDAGPHPSITRNIPSSTGHIPIAMRICFSDTWSPSCMLAPPPCRQGFCLYIFASPKRRIFESLLSKARSLCLVGGGYRSSFVSKHCILLEPFWHAHSLLEREQLCKAPCLSKPCLKVVLLNQKYFLCAQNTYVDRVCAPRNPPRNRPRTTPPLGKDPIAFSCWAFLLAYLCLPSLRHC